MEYRVVEYKKGRFIRYHIVDHEGIIIDNANGYGYKTKESATKVLWFKYKGGEEKLGSQ